MPDLRQPIEALRRELRSFQISKKVDYHNMLLGHPGAFIDLFRHVIADHTVQLSTYLVNHGYHSSGTGDYKFMELVFKMCREVFNFRPVLTLVQFFTKGFPEKKLELALQFIRESQQFLRNINKQYSTGCRGKLINDPFKNAVTLGATSQSQNACNRSGSIVQRTQKLEYSSSQSSVPKRELSLSSALSAPTNLSKIDSEKNIQLHPLSTRSVGITKSDKQRRNYSFEQETAIPSDANTLLGNAVKQNKQLNTQPLKKSTSVTQSTTLRSSSGKYSQQNLNSVINSNDVDNHHTLLPLKPFSTAARNKSHNGDSSISIELILDRISLQLDHLSSKVCILETRVTQLENVETQPPSTIGRESRISDKPHLIDSSVKGQHNYSKVLAWSSLDMSSHSASGTKLSDTNQRLHAPDNIVASPPKLMTDYRDGDTYAIDKPAVMSESFNSEGGNLSPPTLHFSSDVSALWNKHGPSVEKSKLATNHRVNELTYFNVDNLMSYSHTDSACLDNQLQNSFKTSMQQKAENLSSSAPHVYAGNHVSDQLMSDLADATEASSVKEEGAFTKILAASANKPPIPIKRDSFPSRNVLDYTKSHLSGREHRNISKLGEVEWSTNSADITSSNLKEQVHRISHMLAETQNLLTHASDANNNIYGAPFCFEGVTQSNNSIFLSVAD